MKTKLFFLFSLLVSSLLVNASSLETLEEAIKKSDVSTVKNILENMTLSECDQTCLIDLAQQMIFYRKSQLECYYVGFARRIKHPKISSSLDTQGKIGVTMAGLSMLGMLISIGLKEPTSQEPALFFCGLGYLAGAFLFFNEMVKKYNRLPDLLREDFDNSLTIKQLLLRHQNPVQSHQSLAQP